MPTCVITGGAGFIGSHLAAALVNAGWSVRILDNLDTGRRENLAEIADRVSLHIGDVRDPRVLEAVVTGADVVFHLAAMVSVPKSVVDPLTCHEICASGTLNVLLAARKANVRRVVYAGSSSAYGDAGSGAIPETSLLQAISPYAAAKLAGEHYCTALATVSPLETVRLRFFNVFGPKQDPSSPYSGVISLFCTRLLAGQAPTIFGDGLQTRDFVYVQDVVNALRLAAERPGVSGQVFNIGTGKPTTVRQLADTIGHLLGSVIEPVFAPPRAGDIRESLADIVAARTFLGYEPAVALEQGLAACIDYYQRARTQSK